MASAADLAKLREVLEFVPSRISGGAFEAPDKRFALFLEGLASADVVLEMEAQRRFVAAVTRTSTMWVSSCAKPVRMAVQPCLYAIQSWPPKESDLRVDNKT